MGGGDGSVVIVVGIVDAEFVFLIVVVLLIGAGIIGIERGRRVTGAQVQRHLGREVVAEGGCGGHTAG